MCHVGRYFNEGRFPFKKYNQNVHFYTNFLSACVERGKKSSYRENKL